MTKKKRNTAVPVCRDFNNQFDGGPWNGYPGITRWLVKNGLKYSTPNKGAFKIECDQSKCRALMLYPKTAKLIIQLNGKNRAHVFQSSNPVVLMNKMLSLAPVNGAEK